MARGRAAPRVSCVTLGMLSSSRSGQPRVASVPIALSPTPARISHRPNAVCSQPVSGAMCCAAAITPTRETVGIFLFPNTLPRNATQQGRGVARIIHHRGTEDTENDTNCFTMKSMKDMKKKRIEDLRPQINADTRRFFLISFLLYSHLRLSAFISGSRRCRSSCSSCSWFMVKCRCRFLPFSVCRGGNSVIRKNPGSR